GYEHAAIETFHAVSRLLEPAAREILRTWVEDDIYVWRLSSMRGYPPTWRLRVLAGVGGRGPISDLSAPVLIRLLLHRPRIGVLHLEQRGRGAGAVWRVSTPSRPSLPNAFGRRKRSLARGS